MEIRYTKYKHELLLSNTRKTENTKFIKKIRTLKYSSVLYSKTYKIGHASKLDTSITWRLCIFTDKLSYTAIFW